MNLNVNPTTSGEIRELSSLPTFESTVAAGQGFLVITDRSTPTHIHRTRCPAIAANHFETKVVTNGGRRGRYYHATDLATAQARFTARLCGVCHPDRPE
jgi:hypothetical protein